MRAFRNFWTVLCIFAVSALATQGQQQSQDQSTTPIPAYHSPLAGEASSTGEVDQTGAQTLTPDTQALAGAQDLSLGVPKTSRSYWQPHIDVNATLDSDALDATGSSGWVTWTSVDGGLDLHRISGNSNLTLSYVGGGAFSNDGSSPNGIAQGLNFVESLQFRRTKFSLLDQLNYLPEASFGFGGLGGGFGSGLASGSAGISSNFLTTQSILTPRGQDLTNSAVGEMDVYLTPRATLSFVGGYSLIRFLDSNFLDSGNENFSAGYNYQMSRKDTIALSYLFSLFSYDNLNQSIENHSALVSYGRRLTGKLAFQVSGGPQFSIFSTSILNTGSLLAPGGITIPAGNSGSTTQIYWTLNSTVHYQMRRTGLVASYLHGVTGGSGVLIGAVTDTFTGSASYPLSRVLSGNLNFGYSRNGGLSNGTATISSSQLYNYWFGGASLNRPWGRTKYVNLSYELQYQDSNSAFCLGATCETDVIRHLITFGFGWRGRPIPF